MTATTTPTQAIPATVNGASTPRPVPPSPSAPAGAGTETSLASAPPAPTPAPVVPEPPKAPAIDPAREAQYRARERKLVEDQRRFAEERAQFDRQKQGYRPLEQEIAADPIAAFARVHGITVEQAQQHLASRLVNNRAPAIEEQLAQRDRKIAELEQWKTQQEQSARETQRLDRLDKALTAFVGQAKASTDTHPHASALAGKNPERLREVTQRFSAAAPHLTDDELLDKIEDELSFYAGLRSADTKTDPATSPPGTAATPAAPTLTSGGDAPAPSQNGRSVLRMKPDEVLASVRAEAARLKAQRQR